MSKDDNERMKNLLLFKVYLTDKEMEEAAPVILIVAGIALIAVVVAFMVS